MLSAKYAGRLIGFVQQYQEEIPDKDPFDNIECNLLADGLRLAALEPDKLDDLVVLCTITGQGLLPSTSPGREFTHTSSILSRSSPTSVPSSVGQSSSSGGTYW